jgi:hypothetical protein
MGYAKEDQGTPIIEVSPQMVEAGFQVLKSSCVVDEILEADKLLVAEIYRAMFSSYLHSTPCPLLEQGKLQT